MKDGQPKGRFRLKSDECVNLRRDSLVNLLRMEQTQEDPGTPIEKSR